MRKITLLASGSRMQVNESIWSEGERKIAIDAFNQAQGREISVLIEEIKIRAVSIRKSDDLWQIHDFLSARRHQIDGKYDERPSALTFVLAQLLKERLVSIEELEGLSGDKLAKIAALSRM